MAIRAYVESGKQFYEVYVNGFDSRGIRIQRRKRRIGSLRKAEAVEFEFKRELANLKDEPASFKWSEWFSECLSRMRLVYRHSTVINYETRLNKWITPLWADVEINRISKQMIYDAIFTHLGKELSEYSRRSIFKLVRRIFEMAVEDGILRQNPCNGIKIRVPEADQTVLTKSEAEIFLREARITGHRFYPIWVMALFTGMRSGELFALKWTDIDFEGGTISVTKQWTSKNGFCPTKTRKSRIVPISGSLLTFLKKLRLEHGREREFVLPHLPEWYNGEQARVTRQFCTAIGVTAVNFHDLRATFITNLLVQGESLARVMAIVGHSELKTTNGYLRKAGVEVLGATDKLGYSMPPEGGAKVLSFEKG